MQNNLLKKYAQLIVKTGVNVQKNQQVILVSSISAYDLALLVLEECYKAGASKVRMEWTDDKINNLLWKNESDANLKDQYKYIAAQREEIVVNNKGCYIRILSDIPGIHKNIDSSKIKNIAATRSSLLKKVMKSVTNSNAQWTIVAYPNKEWAKIVFPKLNETAGVNKLLEAILKAVRIDSKSNPIENWKKHNAAIHKHCAVMNKYNFDYLHFTNKVGTDLKVYLVKSHIWEGASHKTASVAEFNANMPSEEMWCMPHNMLTEGEVCSTKPLNYNGNIINDFKLTFKNGKVIKYTAKQGLSSLKSLLEFDAGSSRIGEVALVPFSSPISKSGILYYETLFDENASCHLALGECYPTNVKGGTSMTTKQLKKVGGNYSNTHIDFMFGSSDMSVIGYKNGSKPVVVFKNGEFVI